MLDSAKSLCGEKKAIMPKGTDKAMALKETQNTCLRLPVPLAQQTDAPTGRQNLRCEKWVWEKW